MKNSLSAGAIILGTAGLPAMAACPPSVVPQIKTEISMERVELSFDTTLEELQRLAIAAGKQSHMPLRAVYASKVVFGAAISSETKRMSPQEVCIVGVRATVRVRIVERKVYAAREISDDPCLREAALGHAMAHALYQEQSLSAARRTLAENLSQMLESLRTPARTPAEAERVVSKAVAAKMDAELARIDADNAQDARTIDAPESLARLRDACVSATTKFDAGKM